MKHGGNKSMGNVETIYLIGELTVVGGSNDDSWTEMICVCVLLKTSCLMSFFFLSYS